MEPKVGQIWKYKYYQILYGSTEECFIVITEFDKDSTVHFDYLDSQLSNQIGFHVFKKYSELVSG